MSDLDDNFFSHLHVWIGGSRGHCQLVPHVGLILILTYISFKKNYCILAMAELWVLFFLLWHTALDIGPPPPMENVRACLYVLCECQLSIFSWLYQNSLLWWAFLSKIPHRSILPAHELYQYSNGCGLNVFSLYDRGFPNFRFDRPPNGIHGWFCCLIFGIIPCFCCACIAHLLELFYTLVQIEWTQCGLVI